MSRGIHTLPNSGATNEWLTPPDNPPARRRARETVSTPDERIAKSYVWHEGQCYFVSTILRDSGVALAPGMRHYETLVWEYDWDKQERGKWVGQYGSDPRGVRQHTAVLQGYAANGRYYEDKSPTPGAPA